MSFPRLPLCEPKLRLGLVDAERIAGCSLPSPSYWQLGGDYLKYTLGIQQAIGSEGDIVQWGDGGFKWAPYEGSDWQELPEVKRTPLPPKKECPCCGGEAWHFNSVTEASVRCMACGLAVTRKHAPTEDTGITEAIAAWNKRA